MKRIALYLLLATASCVTVPAQDGNVLRAALAESKEAPPTTSFAPEVAKIYAVYSSEAVKAGDKLRAVWIAEDVGQAAPKGTKVDESTVTADRDNPSDAFSVSKPAKGWSLGRYKVELYCNDKLAQTLAFTISDEAVEKEEEADEADPVDE